MFERFTERARRVTVLAEEEARMLNHNCIGTEHILLGLIREDQGLAAKALESLGITSLEGAREQAEEVAGPGERAAAARIPLTPRAKKVLELSLSEAVRVGHNYIGTEHILLGLIREGDGAGAQILWSQGLDPNRVRRKVTQFMHSVPAACRLRRAPRPARPGRPGRPRTALRPRADGFALRACVCAPCCASTVSTLTPAPVILPGL